MPKLIITIEEKRQPAENGKTLVGFATARDIEIEEGEQSVLPEMAFALDMAVSMVIQGFFASHGVDCTHKESSSTPLEALDEVMAREVAKSEAPFSSFTEI